MHKTIGVLGGTFDPVHYGHLSIVVAARDELALDRVLLMPAHVSPFKLDRKTAPEEDRIAMLEQGVIEFPVARDPALSAAGYHATLVKSYVILYTVTEEGEVRIAHVFHQSQDYASLVIEIQ